MLSSPKSRTAQVAPQQPEPAPLPPSSAGGLAVVSLFSDVAAERLKTIERMCRWHTVPAQAQIVDQSGEKDDVYFVLQGLVRLVSYTLAGREITFANVRAGDYFGEAAAIEGAARPMGAVAADNCKLASLPAETFRKLLLDDADLAMKVLARTATELRSADDRIIDLCTLPAPQRVFAELLRMADEDDVAPGTWVVRPMRTHAEIASRANTTRETVTRALGLLVADGIVERLSKSLYIRDLEKLRQLAQPDTEDELNADR